MGQAVLPDLGIDLLVGHKWSRQFLHELFAQANNIRATLDLAPLPPPPQEEGPLYALALFLQQHCTALPAQPHELITIFNRMAQLHDIPQLTNPASGGPLLVQATELATLSNDELLHILTYLDGAPGRHPGLSNAIISELALRKAEQH